MIIVKTKAELSKMMAAARLAALALEHIGKAVRAGISTLELDSMIRRFITVRGGKPSFAGYKGFKGNACISVNHELIHGIPSKRKILRDGDIVSVDIGAFVDGFHGDNTKTFAVGNVSEQARDLLRVTEECLYQGIKKAVAGNRVGDISDAIQKHCENSGYHIVKEYIGHGVGRTLHEEPDIPNFGKAGRGPRLVPGMTLAIEPMVNATTSNVRTLSDGWTVVEGNGNLCAHFEHTIAVTEGEPIIMTLV
ncbi:MAG: type I methionyl aminopeptidase [Oscillospiraceae bacterium]|nr:type I methionyl aminopeptidase [Oscillospiraceae bacterium]